jgi:hypothetical protein
MRLDQGKCLSRLDECKGLFKVFGGRAQTLKLL